MEGEEKSREATDIRKIFSRTVRGHSDFLFRIISVQPLEETGLSLCSFIRRAKEAILMVAESSVEYLYSLLFSFILGRL
jgi:hypothetical protein